MTLVVLSPHLDDAVLSAGGAIAAATAAGERAVAVTLFTEGAKGDARRAEDSRALALLGAEAVHLGLLDAPERRGIPLDLKALCDDAVVDDADVAAVVSALTPVLWSLQPTRVLAPLGVGRHIDHRTVFEAARIAAPRELAFYEDRPYAFVDGATNQRLAELGPLVARTTTFDDAVAKRVREAVMAYETQIVFLEKSFGRATTTGAHTETVYVRAE